MAILEAIGSRYSCRAYEDKAVEQEKLDEIFEAARLAPSAKNLQDWRFVVVRDAKTKVRLAEAANNQTFLSKAGVIIIACSNNEYVMAGGQAVGPIDVAIALEHICLQAMELGLGTCWIGSYKEEKVREIAGIPDDIQIIELMGLGYPADKRREPKRQAIEDIVCYDKWRF